MAYPTFPSAIARCQVVMQRSTGMPEDVVVNNLYFEPEFANTVDSVIPDMTRMLDAFYGTAHGGATRSISEFISGDITAVQYKFYDLAGDPPRYPVAEVAASWVGGGGGANLPGEVATVLSFWSSDPGENTPRGPRSRGRIYVGPLTTIASDDVSGGARPTQELQTTLVNAAENMILSTEDADWIQVSPTAVSWGNVVGCFVDNAFDTQRSRGLGPTARTEYVQPNP